MLTILCQSMMEDVFPKRPRARQYILTPTRSLGYDLLTFAMNRRKFLSGYHLIQRQLIAYWTSK